MRFFACFAGAVFLTMSFLTPVAAIDLQPGEITAPAAGLRYVQLSYQSSERGDLYANGQKTSSGRQIASELTIVRAGYAFEMANYPALIYAQIPNGSVTPGGTIAALPGDSGMGDTSLAWALWPYANRDTGTYWAVGAYLTLHTGSYEASRKTINMGSNRLSSALQTGYQVELTPSTQWMTAFDTVWYGTNSDYDVTHQTLEQKRLNTLQSSLRYEFNRRYSVAAARFYTYGGETSLNGVSKNDQTILSRYQISASANLDFGRLSLQYGEDMKTQNGYIEKSRWILRYTQLF